MSFIVKGIDLPIETDYLRLALLRNGRDNEVLVFDDVTNTLIGRAIQIPNPHGDIKDVSDFISDLRIYESKYCGEQGYITQDDIIDAPTILEAEE